MSKIYALGFNGFDQFRKSVIENKVHGGILTERADVHEWPWTSPMQLSICWDGFCFITTDGVLEFSGINHEKKSECIQETPDVATKFADAACTTTHVATVSRSGHGRLFAWSSSSLNVVANKIYEFNPTVEGAKMSRCFVGDHDAIFLSEGGRSVWLSLRAQMIEAQILPIGGKVTHVSCGKEHVVLLTGDAGTVYSFGQGSRGQLGHGVLNAESDPRLIECLEGIRIVALEAGGWHSAAVSAEGDLYTWGWNESGQLGFPVKSESNPSLSTMFSDELVVTVQATPKFVNFQQEVFIASVACGCRHTAILTSDHNLWTFGWNAHGQLGFADPPMTGTPTDVSSRFANCIDVRCGGWNTVVQTSTG